MTVWLVRAGRYGERENLALEQGPGSALARDPGRLGAHAHLDERAGARRRSTLMRARRRLHEAGGYAHDPSD